MANVTMSGGENIIVTECTTAIAPSLGAASLLAISIKRRHSTWVGEEVPVAENSVENVTLCYRNLQLLK